MPRIHPSQFWRAHSLNKHLVRLLPICRDIRASQNELRWMTEKASSIAEHIGHTRSEQVLSAYVARRARGEPLQYILGSEYFGDLEIRCRSGVLIPRQETAAATTFLAHRVKAQWQSARTLRVLDLCTGSGCIPLLFHHEFYADGSRVHNALELVGVDISLAALSLARENLIHQIARQRKSPRSSATLRTRSLISIGFVQADVLAEDVDEPVDSPLPVAAALRRLCSDTQEQTFDILISNPPYVSPDDFRRTTSRSVRLFEPRLAVVPKHTHQASDIDAGDTFYPKLLRLADKYSTKILLFEVADFDQAVRVAAMVVQQGRWEVVEIWRDQPQRTTTNTRETLKIGGQTVVVLGRGNGRSVYASRCRVCA